MDIENKENLIVKVILGALIVIQVGCISYFYYSNFDDFVIVVMIILTIPIAYFSICLISLKFKIDSKVNEVAKSGCERELNITDEAVKKLTESQEYKEFQDKQRMRKKDQGREEDLEKQGEDDQTEEILKELAEKETQIFEQ